jgi:hypothetical protein
MRDCPKRGQPSVARVIARRTATLLLAMSCGLAAGLAFEPGIRPVMQASPAPR